MYEGVTYHKQTGKWHVRVSSKGQRPKYGGRFNDKMDAAKRVNALCEELGIALQNPGIVATPNELYKVIKTYFLSHGIVKQSEL